MIEFYNIFKTVGLFKDIKASELESLMICMGAYTKKVKKGKILLLAGSKPQYIGVVLAGQINIVRDDYDGNRSLLAAITPGQIFAEALCCAGIPESPVTVFAAVDSIVLLMGFSRIMQTCPSSCSFHTRLIGNMLGLLAQKNLMLQSRIEIIGLKSVRAKVLLYLESFFPKRGEEITIPFNREELANFLCIDRSALSHELARMKNDGLIEYRKNVFVIKP